MNIFKKRISLILSLVILSLTILPIFVVNAANEIDITVKVDSKTLSVGSSYTVEGGETITITATSEDVDVSLMGYYFDNDDVTQVNDTSISVTVPTGTPGSTKTLNVAAAGKNADGEVISPAWQSYTLKYKEEAVEDKEVKVKYDSKTLADRSTTYVEAGSSVTIMAEPAGEAKDIYFAWDQEDWMVVYNRASYVLDIPTTFEPGDEHYLYVKAKYSDDEITALQAYKLIVEAEEIVEVSMVVTLDSKKMTEGNTYQVEGGETIKAVATSEAGIAYVGYYYSDNKNIIDQNGDTLTVTVPTGTPGTTRTIYIEAVANNDSGNPNTVTKTGWIPFILEYPEVEEPEVTNKDVNVAYAGKTLAENSTTTVNPGASIKLTATPADDVAKLYFKWDNNIWSVVNNTSDYPTRIPTSFEAGSTHWLYVKAQYSDGTVSAEKAYKFVIPEDASDITMNVKLDSQTITPGKTYEVEGGEEVVVSASSTESDIDYIRYYFGSDSAEKENGSEAEFTVPDKKAGTTLKLYVEAVAEDGSSTGEKVYTLKFVDVVSGKLDIEPWMEENDEIVELAINLRNDSEEEEKANKNIYALEEVVTYYIDYKNGTGDDIDSEVSIDFELPIEYEVLSKGDGVLDEEDNIITWTFEDGLEEDEAGTLVVKVKYTEFTKSKYDSEIIYPSAAIFKGSKEKDRSTVINLIIEEYGMEIEEMHEPYMYGDAGKNTFRPDDSISRAEGALVLARIYGLDYENVRVTDLFTDLDQTYLEAQKAIIAASEAGLVNGYTDGTYRPNEKMTRAQFMKILACMIAENAENEEIEGLEVKDVENNIKVYADSTRYYIVDGKKVYSHWAIEEVTLLARLNMTPLSADEEELELDEEITRAEVAQLVNFYLLRAPATVTTKTKTGFDDVSRKHDLVGDIIEATREEHTFSMDEEDGTEVAE